MKITISFDAPVQSGSTEPSQQDRIPSGAHAAVVLYAEDAFQSSGAGEALANFDGMRRSRNRTEYGAVELPPKQIRIDLEHAQRIVAVVKERLRIP